MLVFQVVSREALGINFIGIGEVGRSEPEEDVAGLIEGQAQGVDAVWQFLPSLSNDDLVVGLAVTVDIHDERNLALRKR